MTASVRATARGRTIVETDGYDEQYQAIIKACKISLPASVQLKKDGLGWYGHSPLGTYAMLWDLLDEARRGNVPGARVLQFRRIE